jgi:hypothetical protein
MIFISLLCYFALAVPVLSDLKKFSPNTQYHAAVAHANYAADNTAHVKHIGMYLLGSMFGATQFGEEPSNGHPHYGANFFDRIVQANYTYARHADQFYMVTGEGDPEKRIFKERNLCSDSTNDYKKKLKNDKFEFKMFNCQGIKVLHFPQCDGESWGFKGPCCRCENAMKFHLYAFESNSWPSFPEWFLFADDDYYTRLTALESFLEPVDAGKHYSLVPTGFEAGNVHIDARAVVKRPGFGGTLYNRNCSNPCVHRFPVSGPLSSQ